MAALAGLVLTFGGTCGAGPTDLSVLAVSGTRAPVPDDARGHAPVPATAEVATPSRRVLRRRLGARRPLRLATPGVWSRLVAGIIARRGPPPLRGPPHLVV